MEQYKILTLFGVFLLLCGIFSVIFIGMKAKTALVSGGTAGIIAAIFSYFIYQKSEWAVYAGIILSGGLFIVFAWRSTKTLFKLLELIPQQDQDLKGKAIAFQIISLMAIVSIFVSILQLTIVL